VLADAVRQIVRMAAQPEAGEEDDDGAQQGEGGDAIRVRADLERVVTPSTQ
jgi:hypothetical protein